MITLPSHTSHALQPLNVSCFKPFKTTFRKEKDNNMVRNYYNEPNKVTLVGWVDKTLDLALSKKKHLEWVSNYKNLAFEFKGYGCKD
jgi:hypothetical protein